jgi:hypothetical protein
MTQTTSPRPLPPIAVPQEVADSGRIRIGAAVGGRTR